ncbi:MAG TPA: hypothetical protein VE664_05935 [Actinomycetes bacterium]|nr:hypothetical protein [Actinomycetes bacterium]
MSRNRTLTLLAGALCFALVATACSSNSSNTSGSSNAPAANGAQSLKGVCPDPVVVQTDWWPEPEHGATYQLLGAGYKPDAGKKKVVGPLVTKGKDTGVKIEIRAGGPAIAFQQTSAQIYLDKSITMAFVSTDQAVQNSTKQPTLSVVSPLDINPQIIMWDPKVYPNFHTIADIGQTDTTVLYFKGSTYMDYLIGSGILRKSQVDASYDGSPARYVTSGGKVAQQGFATSEPYVYENELRNWKRPVAFQLINDTGYPVYTSSLSIRSAEKAQLSECLKRLVPMFQQAQIDYLNKPEPVNNLIVQLNKDYNSKYPMDTGLAKFTADQERKLGIVGNGSDKTLGNFDMNRIKRTMDIVGPIYAAQKQPIKAGLKPEDIATNEFINPAIGLTQ